MAYKYRTEISWCQLGNEVYIKNERNNEAYILNCNDFKIRYAIGDGL